MLRGERIAEADLTNCRKLAQGLHARSWSTTSAPAHDAGPASVSHIELGLDTADSATIAPVWAVLMTGSPEAQRRGTPSDEIRDATARVPNLWFGDADEDETPPQRFHIEIYVAPEVAGQRVAAAVAAGGIIVDDSDAPSLTVIADQDGNKGIVCVDVSAAKKN